LVGIKTISGVGGFVDEFGEVIDDRKDQWLLIAVKHIYF
jgi:hypothetical protein